MAKSATNKPSPSAIDMVWTAGEQLAVGDVVKVSGTAAGMGVATKASAATAADVDGTLGVVVCDTLSGTGPVAVNFQARVRTLGVFLGVSYGGGAPNVGDPVYVDDNNRPSKTAGTKVRVIGEIVRVDAGNHVFDYLHNGLVPPDMLSGGGTAQTLAKWTGAAALGDAPVTIDNDGNVVFSTGTFLTGRNLKIQNVEATINDAGSYDVTADGKVYLVKLGTGGVAGRTVRLPAAPADLRVLWIKDEDGSAGGSNITVDGNGKNIDGAATLVLSAAYAGLMLYYARGAWYVFAKV